MEVAQGRKVSMGGEPRMFCIWVIQQALADQAQMCLFYSHHYEGDHTTNYNRPILSVPYHDHIVLCHDYERDRLNAFQK